MRTHQVKCKESLKKEIEIRIKKKNSKGKEEKKSCCLVRSNSIDKSYDLLRDNLPSSLKKAFIGQLTCAP